MQAGCNKLNYYFKSMEKQRGVEEGVLVPSATESLLGTTTEIIPDKFSIFSRFFEKNITPALKETEELLRKKDDLVDEYGAFIQPKTRFIETSDPFVRNLENGLC